MTYWSRMRVQAFLSIPPPLRPSPQDLKAYSRLAACWQGLGTAPRLLVLGCTPDFWDLPLPPGAHRMAADRSPDMLRQLWPGGLAHGMIADWSSLPLPEASQDLILCDGGFTLLAYPRDQRRVTRELARVLDAGGLVLLRVHPQAESPEHPDEVLGQLLAGRIANSSELKLRLAAALCANALEGVELDQVWQAFQRAVQGIGDLPRACGWPLDDIERLRAYSGCRDRYTFPSLEQQVALFESKGSPFRLEAIEHSHGNAGFRSPILALRRK